MKKKRQTKVKPFLPAPRKCPIISKNLVKPFNQEMPVVSTNFISSHKNTNFVEIFTICKNKTFDESMEENIEMQTINAPLDVEPCSSTNEDDNLVDNVRHNKPVKFKRESTWSNVRIQVINDLRTSVQDEHIYIENFKWLIRFEEAAKTKAGRLETFEERTKSKEYWAKAVNKECVQLYQGKSSTKQINLSMELNEQAINTLKFRGEFESRLYMRNEMIDLLLKHRKDDDQDRYNDCLEIFIDMEEEFVA